LSDFIEHVYFDKVERRPSTVFGYKHIFSKHLKDRLCDTRVLDFTTGSGQRLMRQIAKEEPHLSKNTLKHIKNFLTGVFTFAKQESAFNGENPMWEVEVPHGNASAKSHTHAYTLTEIAALLEALDGVEPARTVIATAAFTGLRRGELAGLCWGDLQESNIYVNRTVWGSKVEEATKTAASKAGVPVLPLLATILEQHRNGFADDGFVFAGPKLRRPLDMHNLVNRVIRPALVKAKVPWHGLHSFRRGIATNLHHLGMPDKDIQAVLRHANMRTTMDIYVKPVTADVRAGMMKLNRAFNKMQKKK
jgi:integrase